MGEPRLRVWRAGRPTLIVVTLFATAAGLVIPILAYLIHRSDDSAWIPALLVLLTALALGYVWRFGLHPRLRATPDAIEVINPFRRHRFDWDDITVIAPGENGLIIGSEDEVAEAWCVQKSNYAVRRGLVTRADRVSAELLDLLELHDPPLEDTQTGLRIRRARPGEARLLTRLERAAAEEALRPLFGGGDHPFPTTDVARRWHAVLRDRFVRTYLLELHDAPVGYVAFDASSIRHLGVAAHYARRGFGSALLEFASLEIFAGGAAEASLWVLSGNAAARRFYRAHGWTETSRTRRSEYAPHPEAVALVRRNPAGPRRSR